MQRSAPGRTRAGWPQQPARRRRGRRLLRRFVLTLITLVLVVAAGIAVLLLVTPSVGNAPALARAIDADHGAPYPGAAAPSRFAAALEATEDQRFAREPGVDPVAVLRVAYSAVTGGGDQGGSTIYQQLAKQLYTPGQHSPVDEAQQVALAVKLRFRYSDAEILRLYGDVTYFGHGFYGLADASCGYFGVPPARMSWPQAALLAGLVQGPSADDPLENPAAGRAREQHVLGRLVSVGAISQADGASYLSVPLSSLIANAGACTG